MTFLPILAGIIFCLIGIAYFLADKRGVPASMVGLILFAISFFIFLPQAQHISTNPALPLIISSVISGLIAVTSILLIYIALNRGMKSAMWIALNINFLPQTIYCLFRFNEQVTPGQWVGMVLAVICIFVLAQNGNTATVSNKGKSSLISLFKNVPILLGLLLTNSTLILFIKELSILPCGNTTLWDAGDKLFYAIFYGSSTIFIMPYTILRKENRQVLSKSILPGIMAGAGSSIGMAIMSIIVNSGMPGGRFLPIVSVTSILAGSVVSVLFFNEKISRNFIAGNILAFASILSTLLF